jgi:hypothetical protein
MRRTPVAPVAVAAAAALVAVAVAAPRARADEKEACVAASDQAQTLRDEGKYRAARLQLLACSRDACPGLVRHDCEKWLSDLDANQPTVVLGARDPKGTDAPSTRVLLDGAVLTSHLDGKPIAVDPGEHTFRYEATGAAPVEQHAVIRVGEKNRMLTAVVMPLAPSAASLAPPSTGRARDAWPSRTAGVDRARFFGWRRRRELRVFRAQREERRERPAGDVRAQLHPEPGRLGAHEAHRR